MKRLIAFLFAGALGVALLLAGLAIDAWLHAEDPTLAGIDRDPAEHLRPNHDSEHDLQHHGRQTELREESERKRCAQRNRGDDRDSVERDVAQWPSLFCDCRRAAPRLGCRPRRSERSSRGSAPTGRKSRSSIQSSFTPSSAETRSIAESSVMTIRSRTMWTTGSVRAFTVA